MLNTHKLLDVNAWRAAHGLETLNSLPNVMRPGKTAKQDRHRKAANASARAAANQKMKSKRANGGK